MENHKPIFSIIVPTRNRPAQLSTCLHSLARLDYPRDQFEVIVVDDGSAVPPNTVVHSFRDQVDVKLLTQLHAGPAAARNTGAASARGRFLAFTDDDCQPAPDWLQNLAARFAQTPDRILGGRTLNALPDNLYSRTSQLILDIVYGYYNAVPGRARFFASNNLAIPADRFCALGGFDPTFKTSEDREICDRWLHYDYRMTYAPEAVVYHSHFLTLGGFWRQHFNYGRGAFRFHQTRARRGSGSFTQELTFYKRFPYLLCRALSQVKSGRALRLVPLLLIWQGANAAGFFWEGITQKRKVPAAESACPRVVRRNPDHHVRRRRRFNDE